MGHGFEHLQKDTVIVEVSGLRLRMLTLEALIRIEARAGADDRRSLPSNQVSLFSNNKVTG
jgi:hypothetical protein